MTTLLRKLQRDEDGQALVLGAIFALVLMLCVLSTVNLGRAVYDKVQLQTAADAAAYSQAAVEARVLNFTAYTNRAMVVHYAALMAAAAYLTWVHFLWAAIDPLLTILRNVPFAGSALASLQQVFRGLVAVLDSAVAVMTPLVSAANVVLYTLQEGAWLAVGAPVGGRLARAPPEAHSGDSPSAPYQEIWPELLHAANQAVFARTRGSPLLFKDIADSQKILLNDRDDAVQMARAHMVEIANSARDPWVAYGDRWSDRSISPLARHAAWQIGCPILSGAIGFQIVSRTELGIAPPAKGTQGPDASDAQIYSGQRLQLGIDCGPFGARYNVFQLVTIDQLFGATWSDYTIGARRGGIIGRIVNLVLAGVLSAMSRAAARTKPQPDARLFWMSPYVSFAPQARSRPGGVATELGNFGQPDVVVGLAYAARDYNREAGSRVFGRRFGMSMGAAGTGATDFSYTAQDAPRIGGLALLHDGLNAFAAAQAYYHRPGNWREVPNFFNPLWGARLMPVTESNAANLVPGLLANSAARTFLLH
ncbi:MAG TPA: pilus assembly protein TadG-related protein [Myxococcales bacterium]|nr:pilus assembly protein TadG-related protein [Myxococcales bacterium]